MSRERVDPGDPAAPVIEVSNDREELPMADHGMFILQSPQEDILLLQLSESAARNAQKPGEAWARLKATRKDGTRSVEGIKTFHLDLNAKRLTITETWGGVETARRTLALDAEPEPVAGPCPPPDPGPDEPSFLRYSFLEAELLPDEELQAWAMRRAERDLLELSVLPRRIRLVGDGFQEVLALPGPAAPGLAPGTGATLRALFDRPRIERRLVEGWFAGVEGADQAWIVEIAEEGQGWLATLDFERRPGMIGVGKGEWSQRSGPVPDILPEALRPLCVPSPEATALAVGEPRRPGPPDIRMAFGSLPSEESPPSSAVLVAEKVGRDWESKLPLGALDEGVRLTLFRGQDRETWDLKGEMPTEIDELIRTIAARGDPPTSLALVRMGIFQFEGVFYRALITVGEALGQRYTRAMLIRMAPDGTVTGYRLVGRDEGPVGDDGWIGVEPTTSLSLTMLDAAEA
jgi:hypothetical protein